MSILDEPSNGSKITRYLPAGLPSTGSSSSSDARPATRGLSNKNFFNRSLAMTSIFFWVSPWTLVLSVEPSTPASSPSRSWIATSLQANINVPIRSTRVSSVFCCLRNWLKSSILVDSHKLSGWKLGDKFYAKLRLNAQVSAAKNKIFDHYSAARLVSSF